MIYFTKYVANTLYKKSQSNILTDFENAGYLKIVRRTKFCIEQ